MLLMPRQARLALFLVPLLLLLVVRPGVGQLWEMHLIDHKTAGGGGPDGFRLLDVDGDGDLDGVSGWESSGHVRLYLNPGPTLVRKPWTRVEVGSCNNVEDAVLCDIDGDGYPDVVSSGPEAINTMRIHWAPSNWTDYADGSKWTVLDLTAAIGGKATWYATTFDADQDGRVDIFTGHGWFRAPASGDVRDASGWTHHEISSRGRTMSLHPDDVDGDGDMDYINAGRTRNGVAWHENPFMGEGDVTADWTRHPMMASGHTTEQGTLVDFNGDDKLDMVVPIRNSDPGEPDALWLEKVDADTWIAHEIVDSGFDMFAGNPPEVNKDLAVGDVDLDGNLDVAMTIYDRSKDTPPDLYPQWFEYTDNVCDAPTDWVGHQITNMMGKFDRCDLHDLDGDGDLDFVTSMETGNWVMWYENPALPARHERKNTDAQTQDTSESDKTNRKESVTCVSR